MAVADFLELAAFLEAAELAAFFVEAALAVFFDFGVFSAAVSFFSEALLLADASFLERTDFFSDEAFSLLDFSVEDTSLLTVLVFLRAELFFAAVLLEVFFEAVSGVLSCAAGVCGLFLL